MKESLIEQLGRMEKDLALLKNKPTPKPINYQEGISLLEEANKSLTKILSDLNKKYELIDHSKELSLINNGITSIKQSINKKQDIDIKSEIEKVVSIAYVTNLYRNK